VNTGSRKGVNTGSRKGVTTKQKRIAHGTHKLHRKYVSYLIADYSRGFSFLLTSWSLNSRIEALTDFRPGT